MAYFNYNGTEIYYEVKGIEDAKHVVAFFNGVMASTSSWDKYWPMFEKIGFKVILHDFKGQLKSSKPKGPYTFDEHVQEAKALFEHLGVHNIHLVGTSYGGEIAMKFAINESQMTQSITVIDSVSQLDEVMIHFIKNWSDLCDLQNKERFFYGMLPSIYGERYLKNNKETLKKRASAMNSIPSSYFQGQKYLYETFLNEATITDLLHKIKCPTLVVCGEEDILKPVKYSRIIAENIKQSEFVILPDCGHVAIFEKTDELLSLITGFVLKHSMYNNQVLEKGRS